MQGNNPPVSSGSCRLEHGRGCLLPVLPRLVCVQEGMRCPFLLQPGLRGGLEEDTVRWVG